MGRLKFATMMMLIGLRSVTGLRRAIRPLQSRAGPLAATTSAARRARRAEIPAGPTPVAAAPEAAPAVEVVAPAAATAEASPAAGASFSSLELEGKIARNLRRQLGDGAAMTPIQELSFGPAVAGADLVARAQTGTGKTLAFLVPSLQRLAAEGWAERERGKRRPALVVLSPTRELAQQIHAQAESLSAGTGARCCCVVGGRSKGADARKLAAGVDVLVATPGRLCDLLGDDERMLRGCKTLVLDEGDRLLDEGFERQLTQILKASSRSRQTLCFSATLPADLEKMLRSGAVRGDHERLDATGASATKDATASNVALRRLPLPRGGDALGALYNALARHRDARGGSKVVVFCPTTAAAELAAAYLFRRGLDDGVAALHSRKTQSYRTRVSDAFRKSDPERAHAVLVATDVAARGVDYPGVSLVVQLGAPDSREQFVHRAGRTGRAGNAGEALLLLEHWEEAYALDMLGDVDGLEDEDPALVVPAGTDLRASQDAVKAVSKDVRDKAYVAFLGHTNARAKALGWSKQALVDHANAMALDDLYLHELPALTPRAVGFMGLKGVKNVRVEAKQRGGPRTNNNKNKNNTRKPQAAAKGKPRQPRR